ncbi:hypothetical protein FSP39_009731 [Pinctada imbricata]|uniref:Uncharacterized protein n=1 Tax=Pinctada imbricata TaxID=66713 RepID=A0AA88XVR7_PINIB|nr:hypothetical protein FSP39_009731 [Pinctada imbricata]
MIKLPFFFLFFFLKDLMNAFFHGPSVTEKGTLCHLKNVFGHRSVKKDVCESTNHTAHFIKFVTHGYVTLAGMEICGLESLDEEWDTSHIQDGDAYIKHFSDKIVDLFWHQLDIDAILHPPKEMGQTDTYMYCTCKEESLKAAGGNISEETIRRHGHMVGGLEKAVDQIMSDAADMEARTFVKKSSVVMSTDLALFMRIL